MSSNKRRSMPRTPGAYVQRKSSSIGDNVADGFGLILWNFIAISQSQVDTRVLSVRVKWIKLFDSWFAKIPPIKMVRESTDRIHDFRTMRSLSSPCCPPKTETSKDEDVDLFRRWLPVSHSQRDLENRIPWIWLSLIRELRLLLSWSWMFQRNRSSSTLKDSRRSVGENDHERQVPLSLRNQGIVEMPREKDHTIPMPILGT